MKIHKLYLYLGAIFFVLFFGSCVDKSKPNIQSGEVAKKEEIPSKDYLSIPWVNFQLNQLKSDSTKYTLQRQAKELDEQGFALYKKKKDKEAVTLYEKSIDSYPLGETYYNYGNSLSNIDRLEDSIKAYKIARYLNAPKPEFVLYNIACSYSRLNQVEMSYKYLTKAVDNGYKAFDYIKNDSDMANTRKDPNWNNRFKEIISPSRKKSKEEIVEKEDCEFLGKVWSENSCKEKKITISKTEKENCEILGKVWSESSCKEKEITEVKIEKENFTNSIGMEFVLIPAGEFMMGCSEEENKCFDSEKPAHKVRITKPFYMGKFEVTQGQWKAVMGTNPSNYKDCGDNCPVEQVSWNDVQEFIKKLNSKEGKKYRLPTEAEWEYVARAGTTTKYYSNDLDSIAWYDKNSGRKTHPVGQKKPNAFGLYDMSGNVSEWCEDWYHGGYYGESPSNDPAGPSSSSNRVLRGGSWYYSVDLMRSSYRIKYSPDLRSYGIGFRLLFSAD
ncbi:MAG TPA: SUMF1/EgtB/PvdO family nonheme iron enzyme [Leptospiraceae bacterium]|nr:SUMF1/EgtB/PvdO family nonheme iron enzyme [Leptospiraceae bacterium]HMW08003.1 SUMF1/EgtB/PvdO family nonheme iron enzyme [Leptospiraceae bacterium]HMX33629.1 SUMF1/EgtB/PvdO family nonheme iron enzyme [Leptospiraceae bacterium]HMY33776.1 SUMF1/EgtB/PvdO family nonheme iron enzyme [Leptospiraceae bacterium]HMZ64850.1 SUMF1/EgtB/PvdO family nonheme iron enzyme [Leptospiraceae bacterium]